MGNLPNSSRRETSTPWNNWYHCTCNTYGTWLRGSALGWRSRHHREHVEGDYKNPPPKGRYDKLYAQSKRLMKRDPVHVKRELRKFIVDEFLKYLKNQGVEVIVASFDDHHLHVLTRVPDRQPRTHMGWAKYHTTKSVKAHGLAVGLGLQLGEGLWAKRGKEKPINDRAHQLEVARYILKHSKKGAAIWRFDSFNPP